LPDEDSSRRPLPQSALFVVRLAAWGIGGLLFLALLAVAALRIPAVQKTIISEIVTRIEAATNFKVGIGSLQWRPFSGIRLAEVKVESGGKQVLDCGNVRVKCRPSLKRPFIIVEEVYLEKPFLQLEKNADGKWLLPASVGIRGQGGGHGANPSWSYVSLPKILINSGTILARQQGNTILSIKDISGSVKLVTVQGAEGSEIRLDFENIHAQAEAGEWAMWDIDGSGTLAGHELQLVNTLISGPNGCRIGIQGRWDIANLDKGSANLVINNLSADIIPPLRSHPTGLFALSGSINITRSENRWSIEHDLATNLGDIKGVFEITGTAGGPSTVKLDSGFAGLKVHVSPYFPDSRLNGRMEIEAVVEGLNLLEAKFKANFDPSDIGAEFVQACDLSGTFEKSVLSITSSSVRCSLADFKFSLIADLRGLTDSGHKGGISAEVSFEKGNLARINSSLSKNLGGKISIQANYDQGSFTNPRLWQAKADANLNIPETISLKGSGSYNKEEIKADYDIDLTDAQKIALLFPQWKGKGRITSRGTLNGKWPDLIWDGTINSQRFQYSDYQADQLALKAKGKLIGKEEVREISLKAQNVILGGQKLSSINIELDQQKSSCSFRLQGSGILNQISARLSGKLERIWEFPLLAVSTQGQVEWKNLSVATDAKFEIQKDGLKIHSGAFQQGKEKITVSGGFISESRAELSLSGDSINVARISELLGLKDRLSGTFSGQVQVSGRSDQPECRINLKGNDCIIGGKQRIEILTVQGNYSKDLFTVQGTAKASAVRSPIAISGKIPLRLSLNPPKFDLRLSDEFSSEIKIPGLYAEALVPFMGILSKADGLLEGEIHCGGSLKQPVVSGGGTWKDGSFQAKRWSHAAENIQAEWQVDSRNLYVRKAAVSHLGGFVSVTGQIDYPQFNTFSFKAEGKDIQVPDLYGISGKVSGYAEIKDSPQAAQLTGTLLFSNAQMSLGKLETDIAQNIQVIEPNTSGNLIELTASKNPSKFANRLSMDVRLELPQSGTWVTGKGLKAEISGVLALKKEPAEGVRLVGELNAIRGVYNFQGKELKIIEGSFVFVGTPEGEPQVRILCQKDIRDVTVQALISGPLSHPKLVFSSMPAMNQVDILSYFMFDRPAGDLGSNQSSQLQSSAAAWLGSESSNAIKGVLGDNVMAPDRVGYRSYSGKYDHRFSYDQSQATTGKETGIVEIGKDITQNLQVLYGREISGTEGNEVQIEYRATKNLSVKTQVGAEQSGLDVFWRHDFGK